MFNSPFIFYFIFLLAIHGILRSLLQHKSWKAPYSFYLLHNPTSIKFHREICHGCPINASKNVVLNSRFCDRRQQWNSFVPNWMKTKRIIFFWEHPGPLVGTAIILNFLFNVFSIFLGWSVYFFSPIATYCGQLADCPNPWWPH